MVLKFCCVKEKDKKYKLLNKLTLTQMDGAM